VFERMVQDGEAAFAARDEPQKLDEALELWRAAIRFRPQGVALYERASEAARLRAATLDGSDERKARELSALAVAFAERGLCAQNTTVCQRAREGKPPREIFAAAERADLPLLCAYIEALWAFAARGGMATVLLESTQLRAAADRGMEMDRHAGRAAPDRVLGGLDASLPIDGGGDLRSAEIHFESALAAAPGFLPTRVDYAERLLWRRLHARARYQKALSEVVAADANALPDAAPENRAAQRRARALLDKVGK
jgi:hypothetical protein